MTETNTPTDILGLQVAALTATRACPCLESHACESCNRFFEDVMDTYGEGPDPRREDCYDSCLCRGSGCVYVLDPSTSEHPLGEHELRVPCLGNDGFCNLGGENCQCLHRKWMPSDDFWAWLRASVKLGVTFPPLSDSITKLQFYRIIAEAVQALVAQEGE